MAFTTLYHFPQVSHVDAAWISLNDVGKDMQVRKRTWIDIIQISTELGFHQFSPLCFTIII